jgi:3-hydroxyacyl-CoA dehydrogenase
MLADCVDVDVLSSNVAAVSGRSFPIERVVVVGSGPMTAGIAAACAAAHATVFITARNEQRAAAAVRLGAVTSAPFSPEPFQEADLVVEAIVEDLSAKRELYAKIEAWLERRPFWQATPRVCKAEAVPLEPNERRRVPRRKLAC